MAKRKSRATRLGEILEKLGTIQTDIEQILPSDVEQEDLKPEEAEKLVDQINNLIGGISDYASAITELKEEIDNWKESLPENLQNGSKADELDECSGTLDDGINNLESISDISDLADAQGAVDELSDAISTLEGVSFPRMFG